MTTLDKVKGIFSDSGVSVSEWARDHGFSTGLVYQVLNGDRKCQRGQSHKIAVALGIKNGSDVDLKTFDKKLMELKGN